MAPNLFANAKKVAPPPKATAKSNADVVVETTGLEQYAALDHVEKLVKGLKETYKAPVCSEMHEHFVHEGIKRGKKPDNYKGKETDRETGKIGALASLELRKRATTSVPSPEELELLAEYEIPVEKLVKKPAALVVNPIYAGPESEKLHVLISKALLKIPGFPEDFFLHEEEEAVTVVTEESMDAIFKLRDKTGNDQPDEDAIGMLLEVVGCMAIKAKYTKGEKPGETDVNAVGEVLKLLGLQKAEAKETAKEMFEKSAGKKK